MTEKLNFEAAKSYIFTHGRKLEQVKYNYYFEDGSSDEVLNELKKFQNADGGYGHGLESDLRSKNSSVVATNHGLSICRELEVTNHPMIPKALNFLMESYDSVKHVFPIINSGVLDVPAPWWWSGFQNFFNGFKINPTAEVVSHLLFYNHKLPDGLLDIVISRITSMESIDINSMMCIRYLVESGKLDDSTKIEIIEKLVPLIKTQLTKEKNWDGSGVYPLKVARFPGDVLENAVTEQQIQDNLKYDIDSQLEDGSWRLNWNWADVDKKSWDEAEKEWKGVFVLEKLLVFKAFDYL